MTLDHYEAAKHHVETANATGRGRATLDLTWRAPEGAPRIGAWVSMNGEAAPYHAPGHYVYVGIGSTGYARVKRVLDGQNHEQHLILEVWYDQIEPVPVCDRYKSPPIQQSYGDTDPPCIHCGNQEQQHENKRWRESEAERRRLSGAPDRPSDFL